MENTNVNKVAPQVVRERLSKDVGAILSVCIQHFDDSLRLTNTECFDVDAVIAGRAHGNDNAYQRRVTPAHFARSAERNATGHSSLTIPQKGYFIPNAYASRLRLA